MSVKAKGDPPHTMSLIKFVFDWLVGVLVGSSLIIQVLINVILELNTSFIPAIMMEVWLQPSLVTRHSTF